MLRAQQRNGCTMTSLFSVQAPHRIETEDVITSICRLLLLHIVGFYSTYKCIWLQVYISRRISCRAAKYCAATKPVDAWVRCDCFRKQGVSEIENLCQEKETKMEHRKKDEMDREETWNWRRRWKSSYTCSLKVMLDTFHVRFQQISVPSPPLYIHPCQSGQTGTNLQVHSPVSVGDRTRTTESGLG